MKITIRKKDSVTSAVLFVYNVIGENTHKYSYRLDTLLELLGFFGKSETSIRTSLSRMTASGILVNRKQDNQTFFDLAENGTNNIMLWNRGLTRFFSRYAQKNTVWNGQWNILSIADFNKSDYSNAEILDDIYECGLREFNNNVWATPYRSEEILDVLRKAGFHYYTLSGSLSTDGDMASLINTVFEIDLLKQRYTDFLRKTQDTTGILETKEGGELLPVLFNAGWDFHDIVTADPALPSELCEMREEDEAAGRMKAIRQTAIERIVRYLESINA